MIKRFALPIYKPGQTWRLHNGSKHAPDHIYTVVSVGAKHIVLTYRLGNFKHIAMCDYIPGAYVKVGSFVLQRLVRDT